MVDLIYIAVIIAFFLLSLGYIKFCESLQKGEKNK